MTLLSFAVGLDVSSVAVVNAALPAIGDDLNMGQSTLQWLMTGYAVAFAGCLLLGGRLADVFSRRAVFAMGVSLFTVGSLLAAVGGNPALVVVARVVQGIGAAGSVPAAMALLFQIFPEGPLRARALGIYAAVGSASFSAGLVLGGVLTSAFGWRSVFLFTGVLGALVLACTRPLLPAGRRTARSLDLTGAVSVTAGLLLAIYAVSRAGEGGWTPGVAGALAGALVLLAGFVWWERRTAEPLLPMSIFRSGAVRAATIAAFGFYAVVISVLFFTPLYMQSVLGFEPFQSGLAVAPMGITVGVVAPLASRFLYRIGVKPLMIVGLMLQAAGAAYFSQVSLGGSYLVDVLPGFLLMGLGQGLAYPALTAASLAGVPGHRHGVAGAFNITAQQVGASVGTASFVAVAAAVAAPGLAGQLQGFHAAFLTASVVGLAGVASVAGVRGLSGLRS